MGLFRRKKADKKKNGLDEDRHYKNGFNAKGNHIDTGTKFDLDGFDIDGFDDQGYNQKGFNKNGLNLYGFDKDGFDKDGFNKDDFHKNGKRKIEFIKLIASIDSSHDKPKLFLDSVSGNIHFGITAFQGEDKFAKMVSGGNFDFYDNDAPAYILQIKFDGINEKLQETLVNVIRSTFPKKFQIFPSNYSIGAYWINDLITEENASFYLRRIIENYLSR